MEDDTVKECINKRGKGEIMWVYMNIERERGKENIHEYSGGWE